MAMTSTGDPKFQAHLTMRYGACLSGCMRSLLPTEDDQARILTEAAREAKRALDEPTAGIQFGEQVSILLTEKELGFDERIYGEAFVDPR